MLLLHYIYTISNGTHTFHNKVHAASDYLSNSLEHYQNAYLQMFLLAISGPSIAIKFCTSAVPVGSNGTYHDSQLCHDGFLF